MRAIRTASGHPIHRIAFSPCGRWFASAQPHTGIVLHDRASGEPVRTVGNARRAAYTSLLFMRDGKWMAAASTHGLELFEIESNHVIINNTRWNLAGSRLGARGDRLFAGGPERIVEVLIPPSEDGTDRMHYWSSEGVMYFEVSPDASYGLGYRGGGNPIVIDLTARRTALSLSHPVRLRMDDPYAARRLQSVGFAENAPRVALADGVTVTVFDIHPTDDPPDADGVPAPVPVTRPAFTLAPPQGWPAGRSWKPPFALTPDGRKLLVKRPRERVQMWDIDAGTLDAEWSWRMEGITCLAVAPDGLTAVAGGRFGRVLTWDLE